MNRLRASLCALLVSGLLAGTAHAATIAVTTTDDIVQNDNLCSLREAVAASKRAGHLTAHKSALATAQQNVKTLDTAIQTLSLNVNDTYPNAKLVPMLQGVQTDLQLIQTDLNAEVVATNAAIAATTDPVQLATLHAQLTTFNTQLAAIDNLLNADPNPNPPAPLPPYPPTYDPLQDPYPQYAIDNGIVPMVGYLNGATTDNRDAILSIVQRIRDLLNDSTTVIQTEIDRLKELDKLDGCADGTSLDTIVLDKKTYTLNSELVLDTSITIHGAGDESIILAAKPASPSTPGFRLFRVASTVSLSDMLLADANASTATSVPDQDGGAIMVTKGNSLNVNNVTLQGNTATRGGAIWVQDGGYMTVVSSRFYGNTATQNGGAIGSDGGIITLTGVILGSAATPISGNFVTPAGNQAGGDGGAVYFGPTNYGSLNLNQSSIVANRAQAGSGVRISAALANLNIGFENDTFGKNVGTSAALDIALSGLGDSIKFNNLTIAENDGGAGATGGLRIAALAGTSFALQNSMIAGNSGAVTASSDADCDFSAFVPPPYNATFLLSVNRNYYGSNSGAPSICPGDRHATSPLNTNFDLATDAPAGSVAAGASGYLVQPLDAIDGYYLPVFPTDVTNPGEYRLVNRGATTQETFRCAAADQRNMTRVSFVDTDCDIGSIEYQIGQRKDVYASMPFSTSKCVDVAATGRGDAQYQPGSLQVLAIERAGAQAYIASSSPSAYLVAWAKVWAQNNPSTPLPPPPKVVDRSTCPNASDFLTGSPSADVVYFTPIPGFIGETNVTFSLGWQTADPSVNSTAEVGSVSGIAHMTTDPGGSISSSTLSAAVAPWSLLGTLLLGLRRRRRGFKALVVAMLAVFAVVLPHRVISASENVIYVNSGGDDIPPVPGDGLCTLREALNTARDDQANLTQGDCLDGNQGPDVIEFTPAVTNVLLKGQLDAYGGVTLRCPTPASSTATQQVCTIMPDPQAGKSFGLINSRGSISLVRMRLANGDAGSSDGGAIFSTGGVTISDSTFLDNTAAVGGAVFLGGRVGDISISNSDFIGNSSKGTNTVPGDGGALAVTAADQHAIQIEGSLFTKNHAANAGGAVLVSGTSPSIIVNSTFVENSSTSGAAAFDSTSTFGTFTMRNLTIVNNTSGVGHAAIATGGSYSVLTDSIVSSNYDTSGADANCSGTNILYYNNLFGEKTSGATCPLGTNNNTWKSDSTVYFVPNPATAGYLWYLSDPTQTTPGLSGYSQFDTNPASGSAQWPPLAAPAYTPFHDATAIHNIIIDAGYVDTATNTPALVTPLAPTSPNCAMVDQRGFSRASGGKCDIGAIEWVQTTAIADSGSNNGRTDRMVVIDVLANDLFDPANKCVPVVSDYATRTTNLAQVLDKGGNPCATVMFNINPAFAEYAEFVATVDAATTSDPTLKTFAKLGDGTSVPGTMSTTSPFVLVVNTFNKLTMPGTPDKYKLQYHIYGNDRVASGDVDIGVSVDNVPPVLKDDEVVVGPGDSAVIDVLANDDDPDKFYDTPVLSSSDYGHTPVLNANGLDVATLKIVGSSCTAVGTPVTYWQCQFGRATIDPNTGVITWVPDNKFNQFSETFQYEVYDYSFIWDPVTAKYVSRAHSGTATVTIDVRAPTNGGRLGRGGIGERLGINWLGATGDLFFLLLGVSALRRRSR